MALTMQELEAIRTGRATLDDIIAARGAGGDAGPAAMLSPSGQQWLSQVPDASSYLGLGEDIFAQLGGYDQAAKYGFDDRYKVIEDLQGVGQDRTEFAYKIAQDEKDAALAARQDEREQAEFAAEFGSPEITGRMLELAGFTENDIRQAFDTGDLDALNEIAKVVLPEEGFDDSGQGIWMADPKMRMQIASLEQYYDNKFADEAAAASADTEAAWQMDRYSGLTPDQRAKEAWMKLNDDPTAIVNKYGNVFRGPDAERRAHSFVSEDSGLNVHGYDPADWPKAYQGPRTAQPAATTPERGRYGEGDTTRSAEAELFTGDSKHALDEQILNDLPRAMFDRTRGGDVLGAFSLPLDMASRRAPGSTLNLNFNPFRGGGGRGSGGDRVDRSSRAVNQRNYAQSQRGRWLRGAGADESDKERDRLAAARRNRERSTRSGER